MKPIINYPEAEKAVLGAMLIEHWATRRALQLLKPGDFDDPAHGMIFTAISEISDESPDLQIDVTTVMSYLRKVGAMERVGPSRLTECIEAVVSTSGLEHYIKFVKDASIQRQIDKQLDTTNGDRSSENVKALGDLIIELQGNRGVKIFDMREDLGPMIDEILDKPEPGILTGIGAVDEVIGPLKPGNLWTIGARPGGGKTALMTRLAGDIAAQGIETLYLTTEMTVKEMVQRLLPMATGIPHSKFRSASFNKDDYGKITAVCDDLSLLPLKIMGRSRLSLDDIRGAIFQAKPQVVFIDYLQRCRMPRAENMAYQIAEFYAELKSFLLEVGVIGFIGCQTDREVDKLPNVSPTMSHLKGSGGIEAESDGVGLLWSPPDEVSSKRMGWVPPSPGCIAFDFIIRKNRNGYKDVHADLQLNGSLIKMCERELTRGDLN